MATYVVPGMGQFTSIQEARSARKNRAAKRSSAGLSIMRTYRLWKKRTTHEARTINLFNGTRIVKWLPKGKTLKVPVNACPLWLHKTYGKYAIPY
jgi:hypothetical protein